MTIEHSTPRRDLRPSRRDFLKAVAASAAAAAQFVPSGNRSGTRAAECSDGESLFLTRGLVLVIRDLSTLDWPARAKAAGLTTLATHVRPREVTAFLKTDKGQEFLASCRRLGIHVEHELHAIGELLPRELFDKDPAMFPTNDRGQRVRDFNLCVHSARAVETVCENAVKFAEALRPTTGRYFYWIDDGRPMCRCTKCRGLSDSEQALLLENQMLDALRRTDPRATLAHLAYARTLDPPRQVRPKPGIFLEFAPISRRYDVPFGRRDPQPPGGPSHGKLLDLLDANLEVFGRQGAQALEYWLDLSRFSGWRREKVRKLPWDQEVFVDDLKTYAQRGIRHVTSFGAWIDGDYVRRFGEPPVKQYASAMRSMVGPPAEPVYDVVVYGGTSGGAAAAVQAARMGKKVVLVEPGRHLGGLTSGGLGATDIGNKQAIGGIAREFYQRVFRHYQEPKAWKYQTLDQYRPMSGRMVDKDTMWGFEPHVAESIFQEMLREAKVPVWFGERLDLKSGVKKVGPRIQAIVMESGRTLRARMFLDATYEGDLLAKAGVTYTVGREANAQYGETLNGVQVANARYHQFTKPVDPYVRPGDPASGLLPGVEAGPPLADGQGDRRVQAYNFRMCTTDVPENRRDWPKPKDYDPARYELLLRNFEAGDDRVPWAPGRMPNRKTDTNNNFAISTDNIGRNYEYPDADCAKRAEILQEHENYQKGLMWTLANSPRVPEKVRRQFQTWGLAKDEFVDNDNWPHQLYVREARRMVSDCVMTEHHCKARQVADDSVGLAAYGMDSHNTQRYVDAAGHARNEGDVEVGVAGPYPVSYRSIVPKAGQCDNLLVPVCLSATHIAYGSIRMEPVFMILGQSAATAALQAIDADAPVQKIDYAKLRARLEADGQILQWKRPAATRPQRKGR